MTSVRFAGTVDAIQRGPIDNWLPAFPERGPIPFTEHHVNFHNVRPWSLFHNIFKGAPMNGAEENIAIDATHGGIQSDATVQDTLFDRIQDYVFA